MILELYWEDIEHLNLYEVVKWFDENKITYELYHHYFREQKNTMFSLEYMYSSLKRGYKQASSNPCWIDSDITGNPIYADRDGEWVKPVLLTIDAEPDIIALFKLTWK